MSEILKINGLWGGYTEGVDILRGIDMEVRQGEAVGIIGLNGSGKSTLGKAVMNLIPIRRGSLLLDGADITPLRTHELTRRGMAIMQQGGRVFRTLSVWENLQLASTSADGEMREALCELIPLLRRPRRELQRMMGDKLSGGQQHQLSLAMTLATGPHLVVLDEPSAGLSPKAVEEMYAMLRACREKLGITIFLIEQNIVKAAEFCDRIIMIRQGIIVPIQSNDDLNKMFNLK